jgi:hypothetical protein
VAVDLSGVQAKHERTLALLRELQAQVSAFLARQPYVVIGNFDETTRTIEAIFTVREQPPVDWGTLIGDILHNLRSFLDQLVWQLVVHEPEPTPPATGRSSPSSCTKPDSKSEPDR